MIANFLVALSRLGNTTRFLGVVGDDEFGRLTLNDLEENGVDISRTIVSHSHNTYFCTILLDPSGEKALIISQSQCLFPESKHIDFSSLKDARLIHTTNGNIETVKGIIQFAKKHGIKTSLDFESINGMNFKEWGSIVSKVDVLFMKDKTLNSLSTHNKPESFIQDLIENDTKIICITNGKLGSTTHYPNGSFSTPAFNVKPVDTTGAGDCYAAGFIHGYLREWPLERSALFASAVAAINVTHIGGHSGAPAYDEVVEFLKDSKKTLK